jgi:uncharacterized protein YidB (DUF937 family)
MGLLDGLLGQVLGGMAQGGARGAGGGLGDLLNPRGGGGGAGGLGDLLNQMGGMPGMPGAGMPGMPARSAGGGGMGGLGGAALGGLVMLALQMLQRNGGLEGMMGRMQAQGHGREADSWVSTGQNLPISPDVLSQILGQEDLGRAAQQMGLSPEEAAGGLAEVFPQIVDEMTPQGRVESGGNDLVSQALEILQRQQR